MTDSVERIAVLEAEVEKLQASHNSLTRQISQILALAQPEGGDHV